jgi:hypothetical protein
MVDIDFNNIPNIILNRRLKKSHILWNYFHFKELKLKEYMVDIAYY